MMAFAPRFAPARLPQSAWFVFGAGFALAAALAAPSTTLLPAPSTLGGKFLGAAALFVVFAAGFLRPLPALFGLVTLAVLEGAIRKWVVNYIDVFLLKDFLLLGIYAAVLPRLTAQEWRRPKWLLAPLLGIIALALLQSLRSPTLSEAVVGLRSYTIYVPLLWIGPVLLRAVAREIALAVLLLALGVGEAIFAVVQALSSSTTLNKLVSGALPAVITIARHEYLRPSGTFMQSGVLATFLFVASVVALTFVAANRIGRLFLFGLASLVFLTWGVVYEAARSAFGASLAAAVAAVLVLVAHRRFVSAALVPAALVLGYVLLFTAVPMVVHDHNRSSKTGGFLSRSADFNKAGGQVGLWGSRIKPQLTLIKAQRFGHGTGTLTLGSEYVTPSASIAGEGQYSKLAWELGLPGLVLYLWFAGAFALAALTGAIASRGRERMLATVGFGIVVSAPVWGIFTFAPDYPIFAILIYLIGGYAVSLLGGSGPDRSQAETERSPLSLPASAGTS